MKNRITLFVFFLSFIASSTSFAADYQVNFNIGQDNPDSGEERSGAATLIRFGLLSELQLFRFGTSFTYSSGSSAFSQGEIAIGPYLYPMGSIRDSRAQPFLFVEGVAGFGTLNDTTRTDAGFGMGAGVDLRFGKKSGLTFAVEQHSATESATRLWLGYFWR